MEDGEGVPGVEEHSESELADVMVIHVKSRKIALGLRPRKQN